MESNKKEALRELIVYVICGALTTFVSFGVQLASSLLLSGEGFVEARTAISWAAAVAFAFVVNRIFVFRASGEGLIKQMLSFVGMRVVSLGLEMLVISLGVRLCTDSAFVSYFHSLCRGFGFFDGWTQAQFSEMLFKLIGQIIVLVSNYFFSKFIIFRKKK